MADRPHSPRSARRRELAMLAIILLVGIALRAAYLAELRQQPELEYPPVDSGFSLYWARALATGDWSLPPQANGRDPEIRSTAYLRPPGYPFVLAGLYRVTGGSQLGIRALQMLVGMLGVAVAWRLGRALFDSTVATTWAALLACNWALIYFESGIDGIWLVVVLSLVLMLALHRFACRPTPARSAAVAALIGLIALVRPNILILVPALIAWGWWVLGRRHLASRRRVPALLGTAIFVGGSILSLPVARNLRVAGRLVPVAANAGITFFAGNNDRSAGVSTSQVAELGLFTSPWQMQDLVQRLSRETSRDLGFSDASQLLGRRALRWILDNPGKALRLYPRKAALFWGPQEIAHNRAVAVDRERSPLLRHLPMEFALALAGGVLGLIVCVRRPSDASKPGADDGDATPARVAIVLFVACWFLSFLPFFVASLYRVPVLPYLLLGCAIGLVHIARKLRRRPAAAVPWIAALLILWGLARVPIVPVDRGEAKWHSIRGLAWTYRGQPSLAESEYRAAVAADHRSWVAHNGLGAVLFTSGRIDEAEQSFRRALAIEPSDEVARFNLGLALARLGRWPEAAEELARASAAAPRNAEAHANLGIALERLGRAAEAITAYERALGTDPSHRQAANNLAWALATGDDATLRDGPRAVALAERLVSEAPTPGNLDTLAAAYAECGRFDEAVATATRAVASSADDPASRAAFSQRLELYRERRPYRQN